jgi:hypothetical protein
MKASLIGLAGVVLLVGPAPAPADEPDPRAAASDPSAFEIVGLAPRSREVKEILSSIPVRDGDKSAEAARLSVRPLTGLPGSSREGDPSRNSAEN